MKQNKIMMRCALKNGVPFLTFADEKEKREFGAMCTAYDEGDLSLVIFRKVGKKFFDRMRKRRHYFSYLREVVSNFESIGRLCENDYEKLHERFKGEFCMMHPQYLIEMRDHKGETFHVVFSVSGDGESTKEIDDEGFEIYVEWAFDYLIKMQEDATQWHIEPYGEAINA